MWALSAIEVGRIVETARRERHLTQAQLAKAVGATQAWVSAIEKGKDNAQLGKVLRTLSFLGVRLQVGEAPWLAAAKPVAAKSRISLADIISAHSDGKTGIKR